MVVYNDENIPICSELETKGTMSEKMIKKYEFIKHNEAFNFLIETLIENKIMYGLAKSLKYKVNDNLDFIIFFDESEFDYDPIVFTLKRSFYDTGKRWCEELLHKFKLAWNNLNEMEKYILKCLYFDNPKMSDEIVYNNLFLSKNKFYIYKESGIIKIIVAMGLTTNVDNYSYVLSNNLKWNYVLEENHIIMNPLDL